MDIVRKYPWLSIAVAFVVGLLIGLVVLGWWLWPVEWTDATPAQLAPEYQSAYVKMTADLYSLTGNAEMVQQALGGWDGAAVACSVAETTADAGERARLEAIATVANGVGCAGVAVPTEEEGGGISGVLLPALFLILLLGGLVVAIFYFLNRRNRARDESEPNELIYEEVPQSAPAAAAETQEDVTAVALARFHTTYSRGHDAYDDSFSIENSNAEFLGECGVGIAESIGTDATKNVTALEIWLFDKSDIRTITKVVMSDHAFFDDALKAKLAPKGEPVLARESETIVLETASLIINADITEMAYGSAGDLPPKSYFDRITISLSVWSKEGGAMSQPQSVGDDVDELMEF
ncbi:MAG: hypothetical protein R3293_19300 [Candidatus Promineifilaceae bacterium]|nr:hypothetical protein [Candidatus Promineifilaceae bacterium]